MIRIDRSTSKRRYSRLLTRARSAGAKRFARIGKHCNNVMARSIGWHRLAFESAIEYINLPPLITHSIEANLVANLLVAAVYRFVRCSLSVCFSAGEPVASTVCARSFAPSIGFQSVSLLCGCLSIKRFSSRLIRHNQLNCDKPESASHINYRQ